MAAHLQESSISPIILATESGDIPVTRCMSTDPASAAATQSSIDWLNIHPVLDDFALASLLRTCGLSRPQRELDELLNRFESEQELLEALPLTLDAAIDVMLYQIQDEGVSRGDASARLATAHPELRTSILTTAEITNIVEASESPQDATPVFPEKSLPQEFGHSLPGGGRRFELRSLIGSGTYADVYLAVDRRLSNCVSDAMVAIKILRIKDPTDRLQERLHEEAVRTRLIEHRNVLRVLDFGVGESGEPFIVLEYVHGGNLQQYVDSLSHLPSVHRAVQLVIEVARGVEAAHQAGLAHCDLKPANILIGADDSPKVADFGIAVNLRQRGDTIAASDALGAGTLAFMAPEQMRGDPALLSPACDVYALGGLLWWLLSGMLPNDHSGIEPPSVHRQETTRSYLSPRMDRVLAMIRGRAMSPTISNRYSSAGMLADDLQRWIEHRPIRWTRPSLLRTALLFARRHPVTSVAAALAITLTISVIGGLLRINHLSTLLHEQHIEAAVAEAHRQEELRWRRQAAHDLEKLLSALSGIAQIDMASNTLLTLWALEWVHGSSLLQDPDALLKVWGTRCDVVEGIVNELRQNAPGDKVSILVWETALGYWYVQAGRHNEAIRLLDGTSEGWRLLTGQEDPWRIAAMAIRECAYCLASTENDDQSDRISDRCRTSLEDRLHSLEQHKSFACIRALVERTLRDQF